ncbi:DUF1844 domain-containing protein [Paracidobacterium acidisoli]|uniref:DUF1844 domain-containing protein n=1 Tax=Paracidobacterium acidisoli TaxID=2303751 RepID=A0A372IJN4_9BACT|nr:DUF1844 domain-containing protein [Paracidobacterium acidisoli]MBT9333062.1 DUF1844 domain-containing protein [Paracidobacterium acidisoli]
MAEKPPAFTVTDRRKFTSEGDLRPDETGETSSSAASETRPASAAESTGGRVVTMPSPKSETPAAKAAPVKQEEPETEAPETETEEGLPGYTDEENAEQHAAYQQSSQQIDDMLRQANPGMGPSAAVTFEHVIQSIYVSAMLALGAGTEQGQKPRIDILGARQSIDMLAILQEKTKGNLTSREESLLQNALFELRMMFLEMTNAIAKSAQHPPAGRS